VSQAALVVVLLINPDDPSKLELGGCLLITAILKYLPLIDGRSARLPLALANANPIAMIDAQHHGEEQWQQQSVGGIMTVGNVTALEAVVGGPAVQHASAIGVRTGVEHIAPMGPGHCRRNAADQRSHDDERIQK